jgi:DNA-binding MarR family transcriptional regulator
VETDSAERLGADLKVIISRIARRLRQAHAVGDVTPSAASVLSRLNDGSHSPGSLAELEKVRPQAMAATLAALEERGLVERAADPADGRRAVMTITEDGRTMVLARRSESIRRLGEVLDAEFTPAERRRLAAVLPLLDRLAGRL